MTHYSDNNHSNGDVSTTAIMPRPPQKKAPSLRTRIAVVAGSVLFFGVIGVIAQISSGDLNFSPRDLLPALTRVREAHAPSGARNDAKDQTKLEQTTGRPGKIYYERTTTPTPTAEPRRTYAEKTTSEPHGYQYPEKTMAPDRFDKKGDYFTPKEGPRKDPLPPKKEGGADHGSPTKIENPVIEQEPIDSNRKIIRTGEMDFEIDSYKVAVNTITRLIVQIKGAFVADSKSAQMKSGKIQGYMVVRMPPQFLDQFILDLDRDLGKIGELKTERLNSQDVTKQFTDTESALKAARTMEERLLNIIKTGKGEIKDLIVAENALGEWRTKIEKMEGELRYYANQVSLSTLTISLSEREPKAQFTLIAAENVTMRLEVDDVKQAHRSAEKAVFDAKGRIVRSEVKQHAAGQVEAILHAEVPPATKDTFRDIVKKLGILSQDESQFQQEARGSAGKPTEAVKPKEQDARLELSFYNLANVKPRQSATLRIAAANVPVAYQKLHDAIARAKGQVRDTNLDENDKRNISAIIDFTILTADKETKETLDKALEEAGPLLSRHNTQTRNTELASERKFGYYVTLVSTANIQPREKTDLKLEVQTVDEAAMKLKERAAAVQGRLVDSRTQFRPSGETAATLEFDVPLKSKDVLLRQFKEVGVKLIGQEEERFPTAPDNDLAIARIKVEIIGPNPIVPSDEGFGSYLRTGFYRSFQILATSVMLIIIGASVILPWALLIWAGYKVYSRFNPAPTPPTVTVAASPVSAPAEGVKPVGA